MSAKPEPTDYLPTLDGWRAIAVLLVVFHHCEWSGGVFLSTSLHPFVEQGKYGVDLFFAISGFLITHRLLAERARTGRISFRGFYARRFFRIIPPALLCLALMATSPLATTWRLPPFDEWLGCLFFFRNYLSGGLLITGHFWSLCVEEHFYLFWPALFAVDAVRRRLWLLPMLGLVVAVWRVLVLSDHIPEVLMSSGNQEFRTDVRIDALLWGAWTAIVLSVPSRRAWIVGNLSFPAWLGAIALFFGSAVLPMDAALTVKAIVAPAIIVGTVFHPEWRVSRLLEVRPLRFVGSISYGIYLFQQTFLRFDLLRIALIVPIAWISFVLVERPLMDVGRALLSRRASSRASALRVVPAIAIVAAAFVVFVVVARRAHALPPDVDGPIAEVYADVDAHGEMKSLAAGKYRASTLTADPAFGISSMRVGSRATVRLCTEVRDGEGAGRCHLFHRNALVNYVGEAFNDRAKFVEVIGE